MKTILEFIYKSHVKRVDKPLSVYKNIEHYAEKPKNEAELYYVLVDDEQLFNDLLKTIENPSWHINNAFKDKWSSSKTAEHNVWLRPRLSNVDYYIHNFFNEKDLNTKYKFVENISIDNFNKEYWEQKYNK